MQKSMIRALSVTMGLTMVLAAAPAFAEGVAGERTAHPDIPEDTTLMGAHLGLYNVSPVDNVVVGYGLSVDHAVSTNVLLGGTLDYWNDTVGDVTAPHVTFSDLAFGADGKYVFTNVRVPFRPYALAGVALHRFSVTNVGNPDERWHGVSSTDTKLGIDLGGGMMYHIQRHIDVGGEVRWRVVTDTVANLDQLAFTGALSYAM